MMAAGSRAVFGAHIVGSIPTVIITLFLYIYFHPNYIVVLHLLWWRVLEQSFKQLQDYIKRKQNEKKAANIYLRMGDFNERQAQIIKLYADDSTALITIKDLQVKFGISPTTAKNDIIGLLKKIL